MPLPGSLAVAVIVTVPVRPVAPLAGLRDRVGGVTSAGGEIVQVYDGALVSTLALVEVSVAWTVKV